MKTKLGLTQIQKAIFSGIRQNKDYSEIAVELNITEDSVKVNVRSVFCLSIFQDISKQISQAEIPPELLN